MRGFLLLTLSELSMMLFYYPMFLVAAWRIREGDDFTDIFTAMNCGIWGCISLHIAFVNGPDLAKGSKDTSKILYLESKPKEGDIRSKIIDGNIEMTAKIAHGIIEFNNVWFSYPGTNKVKWILKGFTFTIHPNESIGLIGSSISGKSTLIQLLLRFYDPQEGVYQYWRNTDSRVYFIIT